MFTNISNKQIYDELIRIKGIGPWTIQNFLIFVLVRLNVLPIHDLAFRRAIKLNYQLAIDPEEETVLNLSKKWENFETIASWYLWETINRGIIK